MFAYIVKRILSGLVVVALISASVFLLFWYGPASPAKPVCDRETSQHCTPDRLATYEHNLGYDNPVYVEYGKYMKGLVAGRTLHIGDSYFNCKAPCLNYSYNDNTPVWNNMKTKLPATISVALGGAFLYLVLGVPIGVAAARRRGTVADKALVSSFLFMSSIPYYLFALLMWLYVTVVFQIPGISSTGYTPITQNPGKWFGGLILAWVALGIFGCTQYTRFARGAMVEALSEDYIRTAKAKGLPARTVVYKHGLRAAMVPIVTIFGIDLGTLLGGTLITEKIFSIQGIGWWGLNAVNQKDLPVVAAVTLFAAIMIICSNIIVDVVYSVLDPRVRLT